MWPTWGEASVAAAISGLIWLVFRRWSSNRRAAHVAEAASEFGLIAVLYAIWRLARMLPIATDSGALARAHDIVRWEAFAHLPTELSLQRFVIHHDALAQFSVWYYATVHVPALIAFLVWLFVRHRDRFAHWRNGLALVTLGCLVIRFVRVAPPRFLPDLGYVDLAHRLGASVYGADVTTGVSDQFAAMPSIHVGWAAVVSLGIVAAGTSRWRWIFLLHLVATVFVVVATGNHWWLDGIVAVLLLWGGLSLDTTVRRRWRERRAEQAGAARRTAGPPELAARASSGT
ncbi:MAG: phosphatase PAP2 family protein [Solirubrobacteraceae bacterium]